MSVETIIQSMESLRRIHEELLNISQQKTVIVKAGSIEKLQSILVKERKYIRVLEQTEANRKSIVDEWLLERQLPLDGATITGMLEIIQDESESNMLEKATIALTEVITKLKQQEQLNQALINQSMQFVQLSLDTMNPSIKNMNYGNTEKESDATGRSAFDSKA